MAININFSCDQACCSCSKSIKFDSMNDTWGIVIESLRLEGWKITNPLGLFGTTCYCPSHSEKVS